VAHESPQVEATAVNANLRAAPQMREYKEIVARIAADSPGLILDWGCGLGQLTSLLVAAGLAVESFDYGGPQAPDAEVPLELYPQHSAFVSSDPVALPYEDGRFEAVLSCGVLEHVKDPGASLDEIQRVLAPAGLLYCYKLPNRRVRPPIYGRLGAEDVRAARVRAARAAPREHAAVVADRRLGRRGGGADLDGQPGARARPVAQPARHQRRAHRTTARLSAAVSARSLP
jgi:SAM-dependent methyltransferase